MFISEGQIILSAPIKVKDLAKLIGYNFLKYKDYEIVFLDKVPANISGDYSGTTLGGGVKVRNLIDSLEGV